ncbi:MAG: hypothetical protein GY842_05050, partial [bacterium]|nr:hypothetical protein [bacterium]
RDYVSDQTGLNQIVAVGTTSNFPSGSETIDINYYMGRIVFSSAGYFNLDGPTASQRSIGWHTITSVVLSDTVDFYLDGILADRGMVRNGSFGDFNNLYLGSGATSYNGAAWFDDVSLTTGRVTFPEMAPTTPIAPTVRSPILEDETTVTVTGVAEDATGVDVFADGNPTPIGHVGLIPPNSGTQVDVTVPALTVFQSITATQTNVVGESPVSLALEVGRGHGPIMLGVGIRETGDTGALGSEGSGAGSIEWINVTTNGSEEIGISVTPQNSWQTITFDSANGVTGFTGNGQIDGVRGTLEHLAIWVDGNSPDRSSGTYRMYVDNVINVDADGGGDYLITDFESFATGDEVLFQEPTFSGSSSAHLSYPPSVSGTSAEFASTGSQSQLISWFFRDSTVGRWVRDTTSGATNIPRPVIDITKPIKMDILLMEGCPTVSGDMDGDCDIDLTDYDAFEACLGGLDAPVGLGCVCADFDGDNRVDLGDFAEFQADFTNGVAVPGCTP